MKKWIEDKIPVIIIITTISVVAAVITLWIIALVKYGGKPITDIPTWAFMFLRR